MITNNRELFTFLNKTEFNNSDRNQLLHLLENKENLTINFNGKNIILTAYMLKDQLNLPEILFQEIIKKTNYKKTIQNIMSKQMSDLHSFMYFVDLIKLDDAINTTTENNISPLMFFLKNYKNIIGLFNVKRINKDIIYTTLKFLINNSGVNIQDNNGNTALMLAIRNNYNIKKELILKLITKTDMKLTNKQHQDHLMLSILDDSSATFFHEILEKTEIFNKNNLGITALDLLLTSQIKLSKKEAMKMLKTTKLDNKTSILNLAIKYPAYELDSNELITILKKQDLNLLKKINIIEHQISYGLILQNNYTVDTLLSIIELSSLEKSNTTLINTTKLILANNQVKPGLNKNNLNVIFEKVKTNENDSFEFLLAILQNNKKNEFNLNHDEILNILNNTTGFDTKYTQTNISLSLLTILNKNKEQNLGFTWEEINLLYEKNKIHINNPLKTNKYNSTEIPLLVILKNNKDQNLNFPNEKIKEYINDYKKDLFIVASYAIMYNQNQKLGFTDKEIENFYDKNQNSLTGDIITGILNNFCLDNNFNKNIFLKIIKKENVILNYQIINKIINKLTITDLNKFNSKEIIELYTHLKPQLTENNNTKINSIINYKIINNRLETKKIKHSIIKTKTIINNLPKPY